MYWIDENASVLTVNVLALALNQLIPEQETIDTFSILPHKAKVYLSLLLETSKRMRKQPDEKIYTILFDTLSKWNHDKDDEIAELSQVAMAYCFYVFLKHIESLHIPYKCKKEIQRINKVLKPWLLIDFEKR